MKFFIKLIPRVQLNIMMYVKRAIESTNIDINIETMSKAKWKWKIPQFY